MKPRPLKSIWMKGKWTPWAWSKQGRSVNCVTSEYEGDLHSNEHYLNSSEMKAWKKFRPVWDLNPWGEDRLHIHVFIRSSDIWLSYIQSCIFTTSLNQHNDQLPVGLLAQLVEHCTGIAEVMGSNPVQAWIFFRPSFHYCLSSVHYCEDPQFKYMTFIYLHLFMLPVHTVFLNCLPCSLLLWCDDYKHKQRWYQQGQEIEVALLCHQKGL